MVVVVVDSWSEDFSAPVPSGASPSLGGGVSIDFLWLLVALELEYYGVSCPPRQLQRELLKSE